MSIDTHRALLPIVAWLGLAALVSGCATKLESPRYSADFSSDLRDQARPFPDACLALAVEDAEPERLPLGCANALNLQRMVEHPADLRHGRQTGAAFAAPVAQAAERYLRGDAEAEQERQRRLEAQSGTAGVP